MRDFPILEFDSTRRALIEPSFLISRVDFPSVAVACFFREALENIVRERGLVPIAVQKSEMGQHPIYVLEYEGTRIALFHPCVGAPLAAAMVEEVIAHGAKGIIACGGAGTLQANVPVGRIIVPTLAIRDEGTSYHYLPPDREVAPTDRALRALRSVLEKRRISYLTGKTWTTDAVYRETQGKVTKRIADGCLTVDMEAAALFAVARFRGIELAHVFYAGDGLSNGFWEHREWNLQTQTRAELLEISCDACRELVGTTCN